VDSNRSMPSCNEGKSAGGELIHDHRRALRDGRNNAGSAAARRIPLLEKTRKDAAAYPVFRHGLYRNALFGFCVARSRENLRSIIERGASGRLKT